VSESTCQVTVMVSYAPRQVAQVNLNLSQPCIVLQALQQSGLLTRFPEFDHQHTVVGIWGRKVALNQMLRDRDRVEIYRPLVVDPKVARRERFVRQGARRAGLFVKKRPAAKAGY